MSREKSENWSEEALKYLRAKREKLDELIKEFELVNGYRPPVPMEELEEVMAVPGGEEKYLLAIRDAKSHAEAARVVMRKLGKAGYHDLARDFKRAGRKAKITTLRSTFQQLKDAKRVSKGVYALR